MEPSANQGIPYGYLNSYPGVPSHWYMDEWVNPFADDADEVRARNAENQRKRERNYDKLNDFFNNSLKNTAQELWNETESIKSIYDNYVVSYENTDDTYSVKMNSIYYSIASLLDLLKDEVDTRIDFLRGFATGFVDLLKGLKAPLEIALAINPAIPLPPGVRAELLIDGTNEIYQGVKVFINDPENTIGAMFQGMFDTGDEEGTAFCVGYATEKVVEVIVAKKVADAMAGPKVDVDGSTGGRLTDGITLSYEEAEDIAFDAIHGYDKADCIVLGKYGDGGPTAYTNVAKSMDAQYFQLDNWNELSSLYADDEIWKINEKFLDIQTSSGREVYLSHNPFDYIGKGDFYSRELAYLMENGYHFVKEGDIWHAIR